jgi:hypothetical protein
VQPRKLGHVVLGSTDQEAWQRLFTEGLGFKISDTVPGLAAFMRCSTDHHNVLVHQAPVAFLHHTSWQVNDLDEVGRGATAMLEKDPERHVWGPGRHHVGSNFFWYLRDPAGNFSEYYSDLDCIVDDALWTPRTWEGMRGLYDWGPPPARVVPGPGGPGRADDRHPRGELMPRRRAVHYDDEIARVFAAAGIGDQVAAISMPSGEYDWQNADGRTLLHFDWGAAGLSGWPASNMFAQPRLEAVLAARAGGAGSSCGCRTRRSAGSTTRRRPGGCWPGGS